MTIKKNGLLILVSSVLLFVSGCATNEDAAQTAAKNELVVASFNVDVKAPEVLVEEQRKLLENEKTDIVGLQEVDYNLPRYEQDEYNPLDDFQKGDFVDSFFGQSIAKGSGGYGNAVVSKYKFKETAVTPLVGTEDAPQNLQQQLVDIYANLDPASDTSNEDMMLVWGKDGLVSKGAIEPRSYTRVVVEKDDAEIAFYSTHLSVESTDIRTKQMEQLKQDLDNDPVTYKIIVGDFNVDEGTNEFNLFNDGYKLANGYEGTWLETVAEEDLARKSVEKGVRVKFLDNIIVSDNIAINDVKVVKTDLSDHYPIFATIELN